MKIPKEIADKVQEYQILNGKAQCLWNEVMEWLNENTNSDGVDIEDIFITDKPTGEKQNADGEYCEQHTLGIIEDSFYGKYYHQIEGSDKYVGYDFSC